MGTVLVPQRGSACMQRTYNKRRVRVHLIQKNPPYFGGRPYSRPHGWPHSQPCRGDTHKKNIWAKSVFRIHSNLYSTPLFTHSPLGIYFSCWLLRLNLKGETHQPHCLSTTHMQIQYYFGLEMHKSTPLPEGLEVSICSLYMDISICSLQMDMSTV